MDKDKYLTVAEVAEKFKVDKVTVYRMLRKKQLPAVRFGKSWRINNKKLTKMFKCI